jgi:lipopolysaccharide transport system ATP-binding protein
MIIDSVLSPLRHLSRLSTTTKEPDFWALHQLTFDINEGEVVAIIGRNGAGKSTLLKILSRITYPSHGSIELWGRVGSILEVGVGFHGELSGRENIYLNGAVLGMKRREITRKFDEIVQFAGVEQFLDTPIKRYSSGMYVRLAFAVAAFLEPEILIVDEVLAVGDMEFQKRCLGKMGDVAKEGRTVLFVSHNMAAARQLCQRAIVLSHGQLVADTSVDEAITLYLSSCKSKEESIRQWGAPPQSAKIWPRSLQVLNESEESRTNFSADQSMTLELALEILETTTSQITITIVNSQHVCIFSTEPTAQPEIYERNSKYRMRVKLPGSLLAPDLYRIALRIHNGLRNIYFREDYALSFVIEDTIGSVSKLLGLTQGIISIDLPWEIYRDDSLSLNSPNFIQDSYCEADDTN